MRIVQILYSLIFAVIVSACASPQQQALSTPSGQPEVMIYNVTKKQVIDTIVEGFLAKGTQVRSVSEYSVVGARKIENNVLASYVFGSRFDTIPEMRAHFNLVENPSGVRVFARAEIVTNPGSGFEKTTDVTAGQGPKLLELLNQVKDQFSSRSPTNQNNSTPVTLNANKNYATSASTVKKQDDGTYTFSAQRTAKDAQCSEQPIASLVSKGPGFETYSVPCTNGDIASIRCEFGNCRVLK